jgi:hypothetical protein
MSSLARDVCGEGRSDYFRTSSRAIWKKFPVFVYIDESRYPGVEPDNVVREAIIRVFRQVNQILGFSFFSVRLDKSICPLRLSFDLLDTGGIGHCSWRYNRDKEITSATIILNTKTRWFVNPYEQCHSSGRNYHMPATVAHELGHAMGLGHNGVDNKSTMRPNSQPGETLRETYGLGEMTFMHKYYDEFKP